MFGLEAHMAAAMEQATLAQAMGEVPVGAVVVKEGVVVGAGHNRTIIDNDPTAHAEVVALRAAARNVGNHRLDDCSLFVTLEPCAMCMGAVLHSRIRHLYFGALDPKAGACGSVVDLPAERKLNHHCTVTGPIASETCGKPLSDFFKSRRASIRQSASPLREDALRVPTSKLSPYMGNATPRFWEALSSSEGLRVGAWRNARVSTSAKTLLLCLSGVGTWSVIYRELLQCDWPESMDVCALDLPGQGCSDKTKRGSEFLLDFQVAIVLEILQTLRRELRFDVLHIVAHGTSAPLALQVASEPEACVTGISLLNPIVLNAAWPESPRPPASRVQFLRWLNALVEGDTDLAMAMSGPYPDTGHCQGILGALQRLFSIGTGDVTVPASQCAIPTSLHVSKLFEASIDPQVQAICSRAAINLHPGLSYLMGLPASGRRWVPNLTIHET